MDSRRDFLKKAIMLSGATGISSILPTSIQRALAIDPAKGSTYLDAEHIVILMQENRSFDHCYGTLRGVRGYNDPRAIQLHDGLPVWLQSFKSENTVAPFRLNIKDTKSTWMGSLPHGRASQIDAWNGGRYDGWLEAKRPRKEEYHNLPLTMGYYNREDLPFDYALADAFTVCDHNFCSLMGSTTPNRSYFWTGKITNQEDGWTKANIDNRNYSYGGLRWKTFPELLQENDVPWKFYQNDLYCGALMSQEERDWLLNFGCNILEFWEAYNVKFSSRYVESLKKHIEILEQDIIWNLERSKNYNEETKQEIIKKKEKVKSLKIKLAKWSQDNFDQLSAYEKELFHRAFITNKGDVDYRSLTTFNYNDHGQQRDVTIPKGDTLYQFRKDVEEDKLATVNWLASPKYFSDHPTVPWYGTWYTSEVLNILTKNPEVWKKTIFILTFDENDGYFDHVPPFAVPDPKRPDTGLVSKGIDTEEEWIRKENEIRGGTSEKNAREAPIGLGFRVPMIIASPWSRGGKVCSEIFDHTSTLQFLEHFIKNKFNKDIHIKNISQWRRTICGDLTSAFSPFEGKIEHLPFLEKDKTIEGIYNAQFKQVPSDYKKLTRKEMKALAQDLYSSGVMPKQEPGVKIASVLPYELRVDGQINKNMFEIDYSAGNKIFGRKSSGVPFTVYSYRNKSITNNYSDRMRVWQYAVSPGDTLKDSYKVSDFDDGIYELMVYGPNGFYREFRGNNIDPNLVIKCDYEQDKENTFSLSGRVKLILENNTAHSLSLKIIDNGYYNENNKEIALNANTTKEVIIRGNYGWYDFAVQVKEHNEFKRRFAGKVETGKEGSTDPIMGRAV